MNLKETQDLAQERLNKLVSKCWEDEQFKQELIANPAETLKAFHGNEINADKLAGKKIVINDQTDQSVIYINIPAKLNLDDLELSDEDLESVAGGGEVGRPGSARIITSTIWCDFY